VRSGTCSGPHDFFGEDPVGLLHGGQLEFLLGAEVRVQAARAHPGRRMQSKGEASLVGQKLGTKDR
jgi:hypothetical protein